MIHISYVLHKAFLQHFFHKYQCSKTLEEGGLVLFPFCFLSSFKMVLKRKKL